MSRERALDAVGVQRAKDLKLAGRTYREVASVLGCSVGVVSKAIQGRYDEAPEGPVAPSGQLNAPRVAGIRPGSPTTPSGATNEAREPAPPMNNTEILEDARQKYAELSRDIDDARRERNDAKVLACQRLMAPLLAQIQKLTPDEWQDPNELPDMVAAAKRSRRKHHELMTKLLDEFHAKKGTE